MPGQLHDQITRKPAGVFNQHHLGAAVAAERHHVGEGGPGVDGIGATYCRVIELLDHLQPMGFGVGQDGFPLPAH